MYTLHITLYNVQFTYPNRIRFLTSRIRTQRTGSGSCILLGPELYDRSRFRTRGRKFWKAGPRTELCYTLYGDPQHCELMSWSWSRSGLLFSGLRFTPKTGRLRLPNPSPRTAIVSTNVMRKVFTTISHVRGLHSTVQGSVKFDRQTSQCRGCKNINFSRRKNWRV